ncbi:MAG: helix-turn-helix transcriptional regulator [Phycisphaerae bacterium]
MASKSSNMADLIQRAFRESGMSLKRLSDESGTRYASVHAFFTAERDPQLSTIQAWCNVLGLELRTTRRKGR